MRIREAQKHQKHTDPDPGHRYLHLHHSSKITSHKEVTEHIKFFLAIFAWWWKHLKPDPYLWPTDRIREAQKHTDPSDPDADPQHWYTVFLFILFVHLFKSFDPWHFEQCCGSGMYLGSRIRFFPSLIKGEKDSESRPGSASNNLSIFNPKTVSNFSEKIIWSHKTVVIRGFLNFFACWKKDRVADPYQ
jgi:hypothetical protein